MERILEQKEIQVAVVGLGYVGLPLAVAFAEHVPTIGFDINAAKINLYKQGIDPTEELGPERMMSMTVFLKSLWSMIIVPKSSRSRC